MSHFRRFLLPLLVLGLVLGLIIAFPHAFMAFFIEPVTLVFWVLWRLIASVNQNVYWILLVIVASLLAAGLLLPERQDPLQENENYQYRPHSRVKFWRTLMAKGSGSRADEEALRRSLQKLLLSVIAQTERMDGEDPADLVETGRIALPPRIRSFLLEDVAGRNRPSESALARLAGWLRQDARRDVAKTEEILDWMESRMEMTHDR